MAEQNHVIMGIHIHDRVNQAPDIQKIFTEYGCYIKTRLGLHDVSSDFCSMNGLVLLEMTGDPAKYDEMYNKLMTFKGVDVQRMDFAHS